MGRKCRERSTAVQLVVQQEADSDADEARNGARSRSDEGVEQLGRGKREKQR